MSNKVWSLKYIVGNPEVSTWLAEDASNPQSRASALEGAEKIAANGWRVWVEHHKDGDRIYESPAEVDHKAREKENASKPDLSHKAKPHSLEKQRELAKELHGAALAWWENHRPVGWSLRQHLDNPGVNCVGEQERSLAQAVAAAAESGMV